MGREVRLKREFSLQFDPAPRAGEPMVSRRVPDYFLVSSGPVALFRGPKGVEHRSRGRMGADCR